jgi:hypothetical protein
MCYSDKHNRVSVCSSVILVQLPQKTLNLDFPDLDRALVDLTVPTRVDSRERIFKLLVIRIEGSSAGVASRVAIETVGCVPRSFAALVIAMEKE